MVLLFMRLKSNLPTRYPPIMYAERGHRLTGQLWEETLRELEFAQVQEILQQMSR
jgi:hypothetical protein